MVIDLYSRANLPISTGMKVGHDRRTLLFNVAALVILFVGYFLTTGTRLIESYGTKDAFRFVALLLFLWNIVLGRAIRMKLAVALFVLLISFALSQFQMVVNILFLLLISASLYRLNGREVAVAFLVPTLIVVFLHAVLLNAGQLVGQSTDFAGRTRSTLGFTNANQASAIYLSFVILAVFTHLQFRTKASLSLLIMSFVVAFAVFQITDTRTATFALLLLLLFQFLEFLFHRLKAYRKFLLLVGVTLPFFASAITYYLTTAADPALDVLLSLRPYFFAEFMRTVTVFDFLLGWSTVDNTGVDNLFLMLLSSVGVIGYLIIIVIISDLIFHLNPKFIPIVIVLMIVSIFESFLIRPEIPVSAFFLYLLMSRQLQQTEQVGKQRR